MATKDWKIDNSFLKREGIIGCSWSDSRGNEITVVYDKNEKEWVVQNSDNRIHDSWHKTKPKAMQYARAYMKKH